MDRHPTIGFKFAEGSCEKALACKEMSRNPFFNESSLQPYNYSSYSF